jgi:MtN3 and saliva related transmembrane protein
MTGDWIGYVAAVSTTLSFVPQAIHTIRTRDTHGVSLGMYVVFTVGVACWFVYGIVLMSWPMIVSNLVTFCLSSAILALKLRYR